jgi:cytochrome b561
MQQQAYSRTAIVIHWLMAVAIFFLFISSWWMLALPLPSADYKYRVLPFQLHKNLGMTLVMMLAVLVYLRFKNRSTSEGLKEMHPLLHKLAVIDHIILYIAIFACCVSGYLSSAYSGWTTTLWWMVDLPDWAYENEDLNIWFSDIHLWACWVLLAFVSAHIGGALYHAFRHDGALQRMLRF